MLPCIPSVGGHVDAPAECNLVVDHDDLLVVARADGMGTIQLEMDVAVPGPSCKAQHCSAATQQLDRSYIPLENMNLKSGTLLRQPGDAGAQLGGATNENGRASSGKACVSTCRTRWTPYRTKKNTKIETSEQSNRSRN